MQAVFEDEIIELEGHQPLMVRHRVGTSDLRTIREIFQHEQYSLSKYSWITRHRYLDEEYDRCIRTGLTPLIIDAGANLGASALYFATIYPQASILALEPESATFELLRHNVRGHPMITSLRAAVASRHGTAQVYDPGRSTDAYRAVLGSVGQGKYLGDVVAYSMPDLLKMEPDKSPFLLKVDIEGGEADLFSADTSWLDEFPAVAIELHDWMLPGQGIAAPFLSAAIRHRRDFICGPDTEIIFSLRNS